MIAKHIKDCIAPNADVTFYQSWLDCIVEFARTAPGKFLADLLYQLYYNTMFYALLFISPARIIERMTSYTKQLAKPFNPDLGMPIL
jgi:hypothetical protein